MRKSYKKAAVAGILASAAAMGAASSAQAQCTGYTMTQSSGGLIVPGTTNIGNACDDCATLITLPFSWGFYGTNYTQISPDSNGYINFLSTDPGTAYNETNQCVPSGTWAGAVMFPAWTDGYTLGPGLGVFTSVSGSAPNRIFNIEWRNAFFPGATGSASYEVRLYEGQTRFDYVYGPSTGATYPSSIGCQNAGHTLSNSVQCAAALPSAGTVMTFTAISGSTFLCSSGGSNPGSVNNCSGATTLLTVSVTPGTNPASTGITVTGDLSGIGGSASQAFYDDGTHGDVTPGDNTFSFNATVPASVSPGTKGINYTCADQQSRAGNGSISLVVNCIAPPNPTLGPDVVTWECYDVTRWGTDAAGTTTAYSVGTTSSNEGDYPVNWLQTTLGTDYNPTQHPVISQNLYRLKTYGTAPNTYSRFEQLGQSWLKHGFTSTNSPGGGGPNPCATGAGGALGDNLWRYSTLSWQNGVNGEVLSVGCTDTYGAGLNGSQGDLGPKNIVNATTGVSAFTEGNSTGDTTTKGRLQVPTTDVTSQPAGTRFFVDCFYMTQDDCQFVAPGHTVATNSLNSASWREVKASTITGSPAFTTASDYPTGPNLSGTQRHNPGILAWAAVDPTVTVVTVDDDTAPNPGTGYRHADGTAITGNTIRARFWVAAKVTSIGGGQYRYEYTVYNHNSDRSGASFSVPLGAATNLSDIAFHAPQWHSGEPYANTPWTASRSGDNLVFSTTPYATDPNANALRWAEMMNFGFTANAAPTTGSGSIGLFKPASAGQPVALTASGLPVPTVPPHCGSADFNHDGDVGTDSDIESFFACLGGNCCAACDTADFNGDGDTGTDADIEAFFRVLAGGPC